MSRRPSKRYVADFETTTDPEDCRVWAWAACPVDAPERMVYGNSVRSFMEWLSMRREADVWFHNLAFDVSFIFDHMLRTGDWVYDDEETKEPGTFSAMISDMNQVYSVDLYFPETHVRLMDSLKVIPMPVRSVAKAFGLKEGKGGLDYSAPRERGHILTEEERDYIRRDVQIVAKALSKLFR